MIDPDPTDSVQPEREEVRERARQQLVALVLAVAVLVVAGIAAVVLLGGDDEVSDEVSTDDTSTTGPGQGSVDQPYGGLATTHPMAGRSETEVRESYPVVRVTWRDGEALAMTMDLVPGRLNIAVEGDTVVAALPEGCEDLPLDAPMWARSACNPAADDEATVFGRLIEDPSEAGELALEPGLGADRYYEGLTVSPGEIQVLRDMSGAPVAADELQAGQSVWLWIGMPCAESFPVQCPIDALVVER